MRRRDKRIVGERDHNKREVQERIRKESEKVKTKEKREKIIGRVYVERIEAGFLKVNFT